MNENKYYVYGYIRLDTNTYFYIGKGKNNRYLNIDSRSNHFKNILNKTNCVVEILYKNLTEKEAFQLEMDTIDDLVFNEGYGIDIIGINNNDYYLVNCTWGGEGASYKQSQETIDKRVVKNIGQKRTEEQRKNLSDARNKRFKEHPEELEKFKKCRIGYKTSNETKAKLSKIKKGKSQTEEHKKAVMNGKSKMTDEQIEQWKYKESYATGTHIKCIELDIEFPSINYAVKYIKSTYNILFNKHSLSKCLKGIFKNDWYGEIYIDDELVKLHWEYC